MNTQYLFPDAAPLFLRSPEHSFGGKWTSDKLIKLGKYLSAYTTALSKQKHFYLMYIDAFAGSGTIAYKSRESSATTQLPLYELDESIERLQRGSATIALQTSVPFQRYIFIEKNGARADELGHLKVQFAEKAHSIKILPGEANEVLKRILAHYDWSCTRAVLFLDPYGMQVKWSTLEAVAATRAIDVWYLVPVGIGISRLLPKNGLIDPKHRIVLNDILGTDTWEDSFFTISKQGDLFEAKQTRERRANIDNIESFVINRLRTIFPVVAQNPARLFNSKNSHMYSFCFAAGNPGQGGRLALKIATSILNK